MAPDQLSILAHVVHESAQELFDSYGIECGPAQDDAPTHELATALGFAGRGVSGSISLATSYAVAQRIVAETPGATGIDDWFGELTNQLLGRIQRRLIEHGVTIAGGLPVVVHGEDLCLSSNVRSFSTSPPSATRVGADRMVGVAGGSLLVRVTLELEAGFELRTPPAASEEVPAVGDPLLF